MRGQEVELDLVILATGFDSLASAMPFPLVGRGGVTLQQVLTQAITQVGAEH